MTCGQLTRRMACLEARTGRLESSQETLRTEMGAGFRQVNKRMQAMSDTTTQSLDRLVFAVSAFGSATDAKPRSEESRS